MNQVSSKLRHGEGGFFHWCDGCEEMHILPDTWNFDGNLEKPTFYPSFRHEGIQRVFVGGKWTGEWVRDAAGQTIPYICHYVVTAGEMRFEIDSTHALAGKTVPLPPLPNHLTDEEAK